MDFEVFPKFSHTEYLLLLYWSRFHKAISTFIGNTLLSDKKQAGSIELKLVCYEKCRGPTEVKWLQEFCNVHCADKLHTPRVTKQEERLDNLKRICQESCLTEEKGHLTS
ncbi:hypothetical protein TSAR_009870 [Trichomalopsis sarcophagae]|uniref:Uncharacterized protein n=1 Tax=Trichomalopsis sarcophagae TaxID=543379 RepID=A0A232FJC5_9HYME|nr:hypothetical protein TSAR_009870 [Trichomalopsis sarcophagae]